MKNCLTLTVAATILFAGLSRASEITPSSTPPASPGVKIVNGVVQPPPIPPEIQAFQFLLGQAEQRERDATVAVFKTLKDLKETQSQAQSNTESDAEIKRMHAEIEGLKSELVIAHGQTDEARNAMGACPKP